MSEENVTMNKYEILSLVKEAIERGEDFLYIAGYPEQFPDIQEVAPFCSSETGKNIILDHYTEMGTLAIGVLRWTDSM